MSVPYFANSTFISTEDCGLVVRIINAENHLHKKELLRNNTNANVFPTKLFHYYIKNPFL
jgi:hypothetical protein